MAAPAAGREAGRPDAAAADRVLTRTRLFDAFSPS